MKASSHPLAAAIGGYRLALSRPGFRRLWLAAVVSRTGDTINFVALPLFVYGITRSSRAVAATVLAEGIGLLVGGFLAQVVVDRVSPRRLLVMSDLFRAAAALFLALVPSFGTALLVAFALALGTGSFSPASASVIPRLVPDAALPAANGLQWTAGVALQVIAAPLGGLLVVAASPRAAFALNAASFVGSAVLLAGLPKLAPAGDAQTPAWLQLPRLLDSVREVAILPPLIAMQALAALSVGATSALLVVLAQQAYGLNGTGYGLWLSAIALGALCGPLLVPLLGRLPLERMVSGAYVIRGLGDIGLGALHSAFGGGLLLGLYGVNTSSGMVAYQTMVQREVASSFRGRAFALLDVIWQAGRLVSIAAGGALAAWIGIRAVFIVGGALLVAAGMVGLLTLRTTHRLGKLG
jgi:MFS family permease